MATRLPGDAVDPESQDLLAPTREMLHGLNLLPTDGDLKNANSASAAFGGPPQSAALIEAGATALGKWWAAGGGASVVAIWSSVAAFYNGQSESATQRALLWVAGVVTAALVLAIAYVLNADLRGRAAVQVATLNVRAEIAQTVLQMSKGSTKLGGVPMNVCALAWPRPVTYIGAEASAEEDWWVLAMIPAVEVRETRYLIARGETQAWVFSNQLIF